MQSTCIASVDLHQAILLHVWPVQGRRPLIPRQTAPGRWTTHLSRCTREPQSFLGGAAVSLLSPLILG